MTTKPATVRRRVSPPRGGPVMRSDGPDTLSLFAGIGGLDLGLERAGLRTATLVQATSAQINADLGIDPDSAKGKRNRYADLALEVLHRRFPSAEVVGASVKTWRPSHGYGVVCGGFPCQDLSVAGRGKGLSGERSGLWFDMLDSVREANPRAVVAENTSALQRRGLDVVAAGLLDAGYRTWATRIQAADLGAPHRRERLLLVALAAGEVRDERWEEVTHWAGGKVRRWSTTTPARNTGRWPTPTATPGTNRGGAKPGPTRQTIHGEVKMWPTLTVRGNHNRAGLSPSSGDGLSTAARMWPTLTARDWKSSSMGAKANSRPLSEHMPGPLNPEWCEVLMGIPVGWTGELDYVSRESLPWPLGRGPQQLPHEPPRTVPPRSVPRRAHRIACLGNAVVPAMGEVAGRVVMDAIG